MQPLSGAHEVVRLVRRENLGLKAKGIAFLALVSMVPLLLLLFIGVSVVAGRSLATELVRAIGSVFPPTGRAALVQAIPESAGPAGLSVALLVTLLWAAARLFHGLDTAFGEVFDSGRNHTVADNARDAIVVFSSVAIVLVVVRIVGIVPTPPPEFSAAWLVESIVLFVGFALVSLPIHYVVPDVELGVWTVLPGVVTTAVGWTVLELLFRVYLSMANSIALYGVLGGVVLLLVWLYFGSFVLLLGAAINAVVAGRQTA